MRKYLVKGNIEKVKGIHEIPQFHFHFFLPHIFFDPQEVVEEVVAAPEEPKVEEGILSTTPFSSLLSISILNPI